MGNLISVRDAQDIILQSITTKTPQRLPLESMLGCVLAEDIISPINLPPFDNSSMDGFAVNSSDITGASQNTPVELLISDDIPAGRVSEMPLRSGQAARIMTGAPMPAGADAVVPIEETDRFLQNQSNIIQSETVKIFQPVKPGFYVRRTGQDVHIGQHILSSGKKISPQSFGMLAALGYSNVPVFPHPRVAIFSSGDELLSPGETFENGKIFDSNRFTIGGLLRNEGCEVIDLGIVKDDPAEIYKTLASTHQTEPDLIISSAGVSVGAFDYVKNVIEEHGSINFWRVNMRPGKPLVFGSFENIPYIGLPGNPVSSYIGFVVFILPILRKLQHLPPFNQKFINVYLSEPIESDGRESYLRCKISQDNGRWVAELTGRQDSSNLFSLVQANALLIVPAGIFHLSIGDEVKVWLLETLESE
ncbi:MAG: molybdopterin molybdotransferase MoeA [Anaerolineae bacterium]|nr:molybdopterin molybdotransferase MoeA [Anaerolineae bacterium]